MPNYPDSFGAQYETKLSPEEEKKFQTWFEEQHKSGAIHKGDYDFYKKNGYGYDYDFRAAYKAGVKPQLDPTDKTFHWNDIGKKPNEPTFSDQSIYANSPGAKPGTWEGPNQDKYVSYDERVRRQKQKELMQKKDQTLFKQQGEPK